MRRGGERVEEGGRVEGRKEEGGEGKGIRGECGWL